jgi:predicted nucleic acid-binding protein
MKVVLDTNKVISGLFWKDVPRQVFDLAREVIASGNSHLLDLKTYQGIKILMVAPLLEQV